MTAFTPLNIYYPLPEVMESSESCSSSPSSLSTRSSHSLSSSPSQHRRRPVSFGSRLHVRATLTIGEMSKDEQTATWYSRSEFRHMRRRCKSTAAKSFLVLQEQECPLLLELYVIETPTHSGVNDIKEYSAPYYRSYRSKNDSGRVTGTMTHFAWPVCLNS
jgi:hypothetical protein